MKNLHVGEKGVGALAASCLVKSVVNRRHLSPTIFARMLPRDTFCTFSCGLEFGQNVRRREGLKITFFAYLRIVN